MRLPPYKAWIYLSQTAIKNNLAFFRSLLAPQTKLFAVVKSNAYGHGLLDFSKIVNLDKNCNGICVDSVREGITLRKIIKNKPILVLGATLPDLFSIAKQKNITITLSNFDVLKYYLALSPSRRPNFHLKFDTGLHRQGFQKEELSTLLTLLKKEKVRPTGLYAHFSGARKERYAETEKEFSEFLKVINTFKAAGFKNILSHISATGGTLMDKKYHLDFVRVGIGLFGYEPHEEYRYITKNSLIPVLSFYSYLSEIKKIPKGEGIGYDGSKITKKEIMIGIVPIGYWHGLPRALSNKGKVLIQGVACTILGHVSMDMIAIDLSRVANPHFGDLVTIIGQDTSATLTALDQAKTIHVSHYEFLTRLNPLIKKYCVE
jgi:alanine racemase